jgi:colicin import membrane protein
MTISCVAHAAALAWALMVISATPMEAPPSVSLPVSFISEKDFTQITKGVKNAPQLKVPDIKPLADKVDAEKSVDQLAPKAANKPEITTDTSKAQAQPKSEPKAQQKAEAKPETKPEAKPETKPEAKLDSKPDAEPEPKPDQKQADKPDKPKPPEYKPDQIANLLKKDAPKDQPKHPDKPTQQQQQQQQDNNSKYDANQIAQLLDKRQPQRQLASAQSLNDNPTLGAAIGAQDVQLSQSEIDALRARISSCWSPPPGIDVNSKVYIVLRVLFKPDGSLSREPVPVEGSASSLGPALADSAKRALLLCQPFTMLKPQHYDQWKDLELKFDPRELLGG